MTVVPSNRSYREPLHHVQSWAMDIRCPWESERHLTMEATPAREPVTEAGLRRAAIAPSARGTGRL